MQRDLRRLSDRPVFKPIAILLLVPVIALSAGLMAVVISPPFLAAGAGVKHLSDQLTKEGAGFTRIPSLPERSTIYANDGKTVLAQLYLDNREIVHLSKISQIAQQAVIDTEDHAFYDHGALDLSGLIRALIEDVRTGSPTQGGSTITQQLVKNAVLGDTSPTFARKFQELAIAMKVEQKYTKDQILELYLNDIYFGNRQYGIGTAADYYFHEPASKLTLVQGALLAGIVNAPSTYNPLPRPLGHPKQALQRRNFVLDRMAEVGTISPAQADKAKSKPLGLVKNPNNTQPPPPYFVHYLLQQIQDDPHGEFDALGKTPQARQKSVEQGGLKIYTTLDPQWQSYAQQAALTPWATPVYNPGYKNKPDTGIVSIDNETGAIRTMLSGRNFTRDQVNLVTSVRQAGSAFKPFTLVAAFRQHVSPNATFSSRSPFCSPKWTSQSHCVSNSEGAGDMGFMNLWTATADSINVVFAQLALQVGPDAIVTAAHDMGIKSPLKAVPSITLGTNSVSPLEMASAYQTFANSGVHCQPFAITRISNSARVLYRHRPQCQSVLKPDTANLITAMLHGVVTTGTAGSSGANLSPWPVSGKTGTTQDYADGWFIGYTRQVTTSVWVGFPSTDTSMLPYFGHSVFGGSVAAPIWAAYMRRVMAGMAPLPFPAAPTQKRATVPNVVGKKESTAMSILKKAHFVPVKQPVDDAAPKGTVVGQSPGGGSSAEQGTSVIIKVSTGKPGTIPVPTLTGQSLADAKTVLTNKGFKVVVKDLTVTNPAKIGIVVAQSPAAGTQLKQGSTVTITVGRKH
ncbi:MAG: penicillin-binding protein [Actinomycetota bacterium]|nr:penicillin-binding protein [Actinomycetota bacterium]